MTVEEAHAFFANLPAMRVSKLKTLLVEVGLGYIKLGQSATTLSGGEAQRMKLSRELAHSRHRPDFYILDSLPRAFTSQTSTNCYHASP